jgi:phage terminase large subunit
MLHWSYWLFIEKIDPVDDEPLSNADDYGHILMNPQDNLANIDEEYIKLLEKMPERERKRFLEGRFNDDTDGRAYYSFSREVHVDSKVERTSGTIHIGMDFNVMPMTAVLCSYVNGEFHIFDEVFLENSDTQKMCSALLAKGYAGVVYPDSTGKNRKTSGKSDHAILNENGFKIQTVHNPIQFDRVNNINRLFTEGRIKINPRCKKLINDLNRVSWKDNKLDQKTDKMLTHVSDSLGYLCWGIDPFGFRVTKKTYTQRRF